jgi:hypothetical protein
MWWSKTAQRAFQRKAHARLRFCGTRTAQRAVSIYRLLSDVDFSGFIASIPFSIPVHFFTAFILF